MTLMTLMTHMNKSLVVLALMLISSGVIAREAQPMAADPQVEAQVNEISAELRCLVCQNQTIADSHAELAVDLKNQVRTMVEQGQSQDEIVAYMVERYGDFVRYRPPVNTATLLLWIGPFVLLAVGVLILIVTLRKRNRVLADDTPLSVQDEARLQALLANTNKTDTGEKQA